MDYLALYRKYRPTELGDVVGQNEIKKILASSIKNGTITHAYLFSGPRGTGKTTMAKILAKMVNCENPVNGDACNECYSCLNILDSSDVIEIDAASNNGVDEIRELREKANLVPSTSKYKVYIIDEVHMLTTQAFNALLKTLEEPPKHVIFILATTEYYKIPMTITSRCQKFQFNKISIEDIVDRLKLIAKKENISIDDESLYEIAKISDGGMRDSINFLDQLRSFNSNKIKLSDVYDVCGNVSYEEMLRLFVDISKHDVNGVTSFFENIDSKGKNYGKFLEDVIGVLKDVILYKNNASSKYIRYNNVTIENIAEMFSSNDIFIFIDEINKLLDRLKGVSRQSVTVIVSFMSIMNKLGNKNNIVSNKEEVTDDYVMAFQFTQKEDANDGKLTDNSLQKDESVDVKGKKDVDCDKDIIINNTFALASKEKKSNLQKLFLTLDNYLTDKKYASVVSSLMDTNLEAAGDGYVILSAKYDAIVDKINDVYGLCNEFINKLFDGNYRYVIISSDEWDRYRNEYISNTKKGVKYELKNFKIVKKSISKKEKKATVVDKLFEIVGDDIVEFK